MQFISSVQFNIVYFNVKGNTEYDQDNNNKTYVLMSLIVFTDKYLGHIGLKEVVRMVTSIILIRFT